MGSFVSSTRSGSVVAAWTHALTNSNGNGDPNVPQAGPGGRELLGLGVAIAVAVLVPLFVGIGVDALAHSSPLGVVLGLAVGVTLASLTVFQQFKRYL